MKGKMNQCIFLVSLRLKLSTFHWRKILLFSIRSPFTGSQNGVFLQFQSCVKTILGHAVPCHEKKGQGRVFFGFRMLCLWLGETVLSDDFPSRSGKQPVFQKTQKLDDSYCCSKSFSHRSEAGIIQLPQVKSIAFTVKGQIPRFTKAYFLAVSEL